MENKFCSKCENEKLINEFYNDRTKKDGKQSCCKECKKIYYQPVKLDRKCVHCNEIKSITKFENKGRICVDCIENVTEQNKTKRRKSDRVCLRCKLPQPLTSFDGIGRICENCGCSKSKQKEERVKYLKMLKEERRDYIYETNPSNYEDWENNLKHYPWDYPSHLNNTNSYFNYHNKGDLIRVL
jgi:hypothetical protein